MSCESVIVSSIAPINQPLGGAGLGAWCGHGYMFQPLFTMFSTRNWKTLLGPCLFSIFIPVTRSRSYFGWTRFASMLPVIPCDLSYQDAFFGEKRREKLELMFRNHVQNTKRFFPSHSGMNSFPSNLRNRRFGGTFDPSLDLFRHIETEGSALAVLDRDVCKALNDFERLDL